MPDTAVTNGVQRAATGTPIVTPRRSPQPVIAGQGLFLLVWRVKDSNLGRHQPTDLQTGGPTHKPVPLHGLRVGPPARHGRSVPRGDRHLGQRAGYSEDSSAPGLLPGALEYRDGLAGMSFFRETRPVQEKPSPLARIASLRSSKGRRSRLATRSDGARSSPTVDSTKSEHTVAVAGSVKTASSVAVAGSAATAGSVAVAGSVATSGSVVVAGSAATAGSVAVVGSVATAGSVGVLGSVATVFSVGIRGCIGCLACVGCRRCVGCIGCIDCVGCIGCVGLRGAVGQRGVRA